MQVSAVKVPKEAKLANPTSISLRVANRTSHAIGPLQLSVASLAPLAIPKGEAPPLILPSGVQGLVPQGQRVNHAWHPLTVLPNWSRLFPRVRPHLSDGHLGSRDWFHVDRDSKMHGIPPAKLVPASSWGSLSSSYEVYPSMTQAVLSLPPCMVLEAAILALSWQYTAGHL